MKKNLEKKKGKKASKRERVMIPLSIRAPSSQKSSVTTFLPLALTLQALPFVLTNRYTCSINAAVPLSVGINYSIG